tara:strand:+ start:706 stop:867 length:162 start_codon:yes stop_codon:yes gene_type:complete
MPIRKVKNGWTFGGGVHKTLPSAKASYGAYRAKKNSGNKKKQVATMADALRVV